MTSSKGRCYLNHVYLPHGRKISLWVEYKVKGHHLDGWLCLWNGDDSFTTDICFGEDRMWSSHKLWYWQQDADDVDRLITSKIQVYHLHHHHSFCRVCLLSPLHCPVFFHLTLFILTIQNFSWVVINFVHVFRIMQYTACADLKILNNNNNNGAVKTGNRIIMRCLLFVLLNSGIAGTLLHCLCQGCQPHRQTGSFERYEGRSIQISIL
jgi:hypothetical protein